MTRLLSIHLSAFNPAPNYTELARHIQMMSACCIRNLRVDSLYSQHRRWARELGIPFWAHLRLAPEYLPFVQFTKFLAAVGDDVDTVSLGVEDANGQPPKTIANRAKWMAEKLTPYFDKVIIYTRAEFVWQYARPVLSWMSDYPIWYAQYPFKRGTVKCSWEQLTAKADYQMAEPEFFPGYKGPTDWYAWQWTGDRYYPPGCGIDKRGPKAADLSWVNWNERRR